ncbi:MAG: tRNA (adenosine(37)-N6)-threonylcarbamoyltransferase complex ATPase subunit type 1 TsaE [Ruminococcaceae bacterium]|nr:tRNA (adenosine(37)-N6)-threonylcarbamoyltransferase complex ATPase subunit type 1 TsaE [Oscillospiraceae bacterium]
MEYISNCENDTINIAKEFAKSLKAGDVVTLDGDLGAGKTFFTSSLCKSLGVKDIVQSPTFTIVNEYRNGNIPVFHFDVYRISSPDDMYDIGFDEYLYSDGISIVEWADEVKEFFTMPYYEIRIYKDLGISENYRRIQINRRNI